MTLPLRFNHSLHKNQIVAEMNDLTSSLQHSPLFTVFQSLSQNFIDHCLSFVNTLPVPDKDVKFPSLSSFLHQNGIPVSRFPVYERAIGPTYTQLLVDFRKQFDLLQCPTQYLDNVFTSFGFNHKVRPYQDLIMRQFMEECRGLLATVSLSTPSRHLPPNANTVLSQWWDLHVDNPYPSEADKQQLAETGGLSVVQVNYWFSNRRMRLKRKLVNQYMCETDPSVAKCLLDSFPTFIVRSIQSLN
ncbi:hypothetical protein GEMRC1_010208 [Eukaryota sp. GEM-RC1]